MSLQIIGAGYPRTGTTSLHLALEVLGFGECYHMIKLFENPGHVIHWENLANGKAVDWDKLFDGYRSSVDFPGSMHFDRLIEKYPDAKIVLTVRDRDMWYQSMSSTVFKFDPGVRLKLRILFALPFSKRARQVFRVAKLAKGITSKYFEGKADNKEYVLKRFDDHVKHVKGIVPSENLLVYDIKEGWEALCEFLNVPIPETPFPHQNKREGFVHLTRGKISKSLRGKKVSI